MLFTLLYGPNEMLALSCWQLPDSERRKAVISRPVEGGITSHKSCAA